jgi:preprotein translocase subunit YajC
LTGEVTRIDEETVTIALGPLVTVDMGVVRLVEKSRAPKRRTPLRDKVD